MDSNHSEFVTFPFGARLLEYGFVRETVKSNHVCEDIFGLVPFQNNFLFRSHISCLNRSFWHPSLEDFPRKWEINLGNLHNGCTRKGRNFFARTFGTRNVSFKHSRGDVARVQSFLTLAFSRYIRTKKTFGSFIVRTLQIEKLIYCSAWPIVILANFKSQNIFACFFGCHDLFAAFLVESWFSADDVSFRAL